MIIHKDKDLSNFYLEDRIFHPHGINRFTIYWPKHNRDQLTPDEYLNKMYAAGINLLRMVVPGELERGVEPELGKYDADFLKPVDHVFELAADLGIQIILCLFDYAGFYAPWDDTVWQKSVYSTRFADVKDFFGSRELRKYQKARLAFLIDHFKKYPNVFAWEIMNEMNYMGKFFDDQCEEVTMAWFDEMAEHLKSIDSQNLITGSLWGGETWDSLYDHPLNDIVQVHTYDETRDPGKIAANIEMYVSAVKKHAKPVVIGEFASIEKNPRRAEFVENALTAAQAVNSSAWLYCSIWDEFGEMDDAMFEVYRRTKQV